MKLKQRLLTMIILSSLKQYYNFIFIISCNKDPSTSLIEIHKLFKLIFILKKRPITKHNSILMKTEVL